MEDSEVDFHHSPVPITEALAKFDLVQTEAKFLLVVEKDSIFQRLLDEHWADKFPKSILVTVSFSINLPTSNQNHIVLVIYYNNIEI